MAAVCPATPDRSIFNSVLAIGAGALAAAYDELEGIYEDAGVRAWTVWVPDYDRRAPPCSRRAGTCSTARRDRWPWS